MDEHIKPQGPPPPTDCKPGFHHPPGQPSVCVADQATMVPTTTEVGLIGLVIMMIGLAAWRLCRK